MKDIFGKIVILVVIFVVFLMVSPLFSNNLNLPSFGGTVVKAGNTIRVEYTGTLADGTEFDSSIGQDPLEFTVGAGQTIVGFENGVIGMKVGDERELKIQPKDAYGEINPQAVQDIPIEQLDPENEIEVGMLIALTSRDGQNIPVKVVEVTEEKITIDLNHPLAGEVLIFKIKILEIVS